MTVIFDLLMSKADSLMSLPHEPLVPVGIKIA